MGERYENAEVSQVLVDYINELALDDPKRANLITIIEEDPILPLCNGSPVSYKDCERLNYKEIVYKFSKIHNF